MITLRSDRILFVDVDDTLVLWEFDPLTTKPEDVMVIGGELVKKHAKHIALIKRFKARKQMVCVWSQGGWEWAEKVVHAVGLTDYVDVVMCKPAWVLDDLPPSAWMPKEFYLENK